MNNKRKMKKKKKRKKFWMVLYSPWKRIKLGIGCGSAGEEGPAGYFFSVLGLNSGPSP
jgi:hypothetical protein